MASHLLIVAVLLSILNSNQTLISSGTSFSDPTYLNIGDGCYERTKTTLTIYDNCNVVSSNSKFPIPLMVAYPARTYSGLDSGIITSSISVEDVFEYSVKNTITTNISGSVGASYDDLITSAFASLTAGVSTSWTSAFTNTIKAKSIDQYTVDMSNPSALGSYCYVWASDSAKAVVSDYRIIKERKYRKYGTFGDYHEASDTEETYTTASFIYTGSFGDIGLALVHFSTLSELNNYLHGGMIKRVQRQYNEKAN